MNMDERGRDRAVDGEEVSPGVGPEGGGSRSIEG